MTLSNILISLPLFFALIVKGVLMFPFLSPEEFGLKRYEKEALITTFTFLTTNFISAFSGLRILFLGVN